MTGLITLTAEPQLQVQTAYNGFIKALLLNDVDYMNEFMNDIALCSFSNFDTAKSASHKGAPERFYHGLETLANAHKQIEENRYEAELVAEGIASEKIRKYGFAFQGKECLIG